MRLLVPLLLLLVVASLLTVGAPSPSATAACAGGVGAGGGSTTVGVGCALSPGEVHGLYETPGQYRLLPHCGYGVTGGCLGAGLCEAAGHYYDVYRSGFLIGTTCLTPGQYHSIAEPWPADVAGAVARQTWPGAEVRMQPPGGRTLVNLPTNFYTDSPGVQSRTVQLLGYDTDLRLVPVSFTWHYGDGSGRTSAGPGARYPSLALAHTYAVRETVHPSVDVTYAVNYRFAGGGWTDLGQDVTEPGPPATLRVGTARPVLIAPQ